MIVDINFSLKHPIYPTESTPEYLLNVMEGESVDRAIVSTLEPLTTYDFRKGNEYTGEVVGKHADKLVGIAMVNPYEPSEADRALGKLKLKGLKLHPEILMFRPDSEMVGLLVEKAIDFKVPIYISDGGGDFASQPGVVGNLASMFPEAIIILGRMWDVEKWPDAIVSARINKNLMLEFSLTTTQYLLWAIRTLGAERLLLGSGAPEISPRAVIEHVNTLPITEKERRLILGGNAARIFGIE